jgi:hypothetical protein
LALDVLKVYGDFARQQGAGAPRKRIRVKNLGNFKD